MLRSGYWFLIGTAFLAVAGCGSREALIKKQAEFDARLDQMVQANAATNARLAELANELMELQNQVKSASLEMEVLKPGYRELKSSLAEISQKLDAPPAPAPKIEIVNSETAPKDKDATPQDAYMKAFGLYSANNYQQAIETFETFLKVFPTSEYAAGRAPNRSMQNCSSSRVSATCVCRSTLSYVRASLAASIIKSVVTENGEQGARPTRTIAYGFGSWNFSIARWQSLRIASSSWTT